jgi:hypothetical protein
MADYYTPTVIQQTIPEADMTPLERMLLSNVFDAERDGDGWVFLLRVGSPRHDRDRACSAGGCARSV